MGCDIHVVFEKRVDGIWTAVKGHHVHENYALYSILANVRQDKHEPIVPICMPKGIPEDASDKYLKEVATMAESLPCHSHSWLTLAELLTYDWSVGMEFQHGRGIPNFVEITMAEMKALGKPDDIRMCFFFDN